MHWPDFGSNHRTTAMGSRRLAILNFSWFSLTSRRKYRCIDQDRPLCHTRVPIHHSQWEWSWKMEANEGELVRFSTTRLRAIWLENRRSNLCGGRGLSVKSLIQWVPGIKRQDRKVETSSKREKFGFNFTFTWTMKWNVCEWNRPQPITTKHQSQLNTRIQAMVGP
jgi:hypothetical protein